jgi:hypothetical protein
MKNFIQFKDVLLGDYLAVASDDINALDATVTDDDPILYTFLKSTSSVVVTISNKKRDELGLASNVLRIEDMSSYPMGFSHQNLVETKELIVGLNSTIGSFDDCVNYASALVAANSENKIVIIKLVDQKFTNKIYYVLSNDFSNSKYLNIDSVILGNSRLGEAVAESIGADIVYETDGITI